MASEFIWYELLTTDVPAAERFYKAVVGWNAEPFGGAMDYIVVKAGSRGVGGLMAIPQEAAAGGMRPGWLGYVHATDVDAATQAVADAGGTVHRAPQDIPDVGRFSVVADPQGAVFQLLQPIGAGEPPVPAMTPGHVGWHELLADDGPTAFDFYAGRFGWTKADEIDMGPMGKYLLFSAGGAEPVGGIMTRTPETPGPAWTFYFNVEGGIDAAVERIKTAGGSMMLEPMEVPGGSFIVQGIDPQGATFALVAATR